MFDDLRAKSASPFEDDEETPVEEVEEARPRKAKKRRRAHSGEVPLLGLTAAQRLVLMIMVFLNVTVLGCFALLALERIVLPF
jgi:hypothetical protein